ncbi:unnamed protein product [Gadus morhua 'NCC']
MKSQRRWNIPSPGSPYSGLSQAGPGQMTAGQSPPILVLELGPPNGHGSARGPLELSHVAYYCRPQRSSCQVTVSPGAQPPVLRIHSGTGILVL